MNKDKELKEEREIRERFKDHKPSYSVFSNGTEQIEVLRWAKPGTGIDAIEYWFRKGTLCVHGDLNEAVYQWHTSIGKLGAVAGCNLDYFATKCQASPEGRQFQTWDAGEAEDDLAWRVKNGYVTQEELEETDALAALSTKESWDFWLGEYGDEVFGPDFYEHADIGERVSCFCHMHLVGLKMAFDLVRQEAA